MGVGTGTGNTISFSTIRDFYGDSNPVSLSEFNRNTSNDTLVDATFSGASTATTGTSSQTVDDFAVTVTEVDGSLVELTTSGGNQGNAPFPINASAASFTLLNTTSFVSVTVLGQGSCNFIVNGSNVGSVSLNNESSGFSIRGPQFNTGDRNTSVNTIYSAGDVFTVSCGTNAGQNARTNTSTHGVRAVEHDITFQNNSSTGDTYNLTSNSTGGSSKTAYAAGDSFLAQNNGSSNQFLLAYDNVTGSGSGTAGDIGVTVASGSALAGQTTTNPATAPSTSGISFTNVTATTSHFNDDDNQTVRIFRNGTQVAINTEGQSSGASVTYTGTIASGDVFSATGTGSQGASLRINFTTPTKSITYQNNGSSSITLGSSSTGGARTIAASASATVQPGGSTNNESWAVHFNTGSGDCNVGIPTTIGVGNPVNMNLFNTVTTPVG